MSSERHWSFGLKVGDWVGSTQFQGPRMVVGVFRRIPYTEHDTSVVLTGSGAYGLPLEDNDFWLAEAPSTHAAPAPTEALNALRDEAHETAKSKGWHEKGDSLERLPELLVMVHAETSEAVEAYRRDLGKDAIAAELSDVVIRVLDICGLYDIDLAAAVRRKMDYNKSRPYRHGGKKV